jgi:hypothetical protein
MAKMEYILSPQDQFRFRVLINTQRSLLGMITPNMRAITIDYSEKEYHLKVYFEKGPSEREVEILTELTSEIAANMTEFKKFKEEYIVTSEKKNKLKCLSDWVYFRCEED